VACSVIGILFSMLRVVLRVVGNKKPLVP